MAHAHGALREVDPIFTQETLGPSLETEVGFVGGAQVMQLPGGTSDTEAWILAMLSKRSWLMFEFHPRTSGPAPAAGRQGRLADAEPG